ncbi:MAG: DUF126 domain-containing protein [Desulfobacteraceae bacterium]|nr:DUF126 domain-containing protein [Desulfobacteraceae bacterium]
MIIKGHKIAKGKAVGNALVSRSPISFRGGVDEESGIIVEKGHELEGLCISGKVLVFPTAKGSTAGTFQLLELKVNGVAPKAIVNLRADSIVAVGAIISNIPMVDRLASDPLEAIKTGDIVEVDADRGIVRVQSKK